MTRKLLVALAALAASLTAITTGTAHAGAAIWGYCTDLAHPYPSSSEPYNFGAKFTVVSNEGGYLRLRDNYGHITPPNYPLNPNQWSVTGMIPVDYNPYFRMYLDWWNGSYWQQMSSTPPAWNQC